MPNNRPQPRQSPRPTRAEVNRYMWHRQFRTLLIGGILLMLAGLVFLMTGIQQDKIELLLVGGGTLAVIGGLGFGVMALVGRKR